MSELTETVMISKAEYERLLNDKCFLNYIENNWCTKYPETKELRVNLHIITGTSNLRSAAYQCMEGSDRLGLLELTDLGNLLSKFRALANSTLDDMAKATGLCTEELYDIEFGRRPVTDEQLHNIACYLAGKDYKEHQYQPNKLENFMENIQKNDWITASDILPQNEGEYLVRTVDGDELEAWFYPEDNEWEDFPEGHITHWKLII